MTIKSFYLEIRMKEIEDIQKQVADILYSDKWYIRLFLFSKAKRLHKLAGEKIQKLFEDFP